MWTDRTVLARGDPRRIISARYTTREGDAWHAARLTADQWREIHRRGRCGGLTVCAIRVDSSCLIRDFILDHYFIRPNWRVLT